MTHPQPAAVPPPTRPLFDPVAFGARVRDRLADLGLSYREAAPAVGVTHATLHLVANGRMPNVETLCRILRWLDLTAPYATPR